jgi:predicted CopG family antitoxin
MQRDWSEVLNRLLERHRRDDGSEWGGASIERATNGEVTHQYFGRLKNGEIKEPGFGKVVAISRAIGASLEEWLED